ncbi:MAG: phosphoribosylformylglycinamidine cyclo-ligase [Thermoplasmata archaeon]|nr:MAG: phosphoribosylformylglycinamidine cyclo-ligase [Thermoplasmata archaeon]
MEFTYAKAGVDIEKENEVIEAITGVIGKKNSVEYNGTRIAMSTDGVGSKIIVANEMKKWDTLGIDCIAMNVNDLLCVGAKPIAFVDYLAMEKMDAMVAKEIAKGLEKGAEEAGISIIGGETATLPEIIKGFDLAGTAVGIIEKELPKNVKEGDVIVGLKSNGLHSNGFTLARKVFKENGYSFHDEIDEIGTIGYELLKPTRIYVKEIEELWNEVEIKGIAHITGSGLYKLRRMIGDFRFIIDEPFEPQPIFRVIQKLGNVSEYEMYKTFNMGMGMAIVVSKEESEQAIQILNRSIEAKAVGKIGEGKGIEVPKLGIKY